MRLFTVGMVLMLISACGSGQAVRQPEGGQQRVPRAARTIVLESSQQPKALYKKVVAGLSQEGYVMVDTSRSEGVIETGFKPIGNDISLRVLASVHQVDNASELWITGEYLRSQRSIAMPDTARINIPSQPAEWTQGQARLAFRNLRELADKLPHASVRYE